MSIFYRHTPPQQRLPSAATIPGSPVIQTDLAGAQVLLQRTGSSLSGVQALLQKAGNVSTGAQALLSRNYADNSGTQALFSRVSTGSSGVTTLLSGTFAAESDAQVLLSGSFTAASGMQALLSSAPSTIQKMYLRQGTAATVSPLPSGFLATWGQSGTLKGASAQTLSATAGSAQTAVTPTWAALAKGVTTTLGHVQLLSPALAAQSVSAASWTLAYAAAMTNAVSGFSWSGEAALYLVNGATGAARTTIVALGAVGTTGRIVTTEETVYTAALSGAAFTVSDGDYLALEIGIAALTPSGGGAKTPTTDTYADGTTAITADAASASSAESLLTAPVALTLYSAPVIQTAGVQTLLQGTFAASSGVQALFSRVGTDTSGAQTLPFQSRYHICW